MDFSEAYSTYAAMIERRAWHEQIGGYEHDDIVNEMLDCLWRACRTYDEGRETPFPSYWWSIWMNRRSDLTRYWQRRVTLIPTGDITVLDSAYDDRPFDIPPAPDHQQVWNLLAQGIPRDTILAQLGLSKRRYYDVLHNWKNPQVRSLLGE